MRRGAALLLALAGLVLLGAAPPAVAHSALIGSDPRDGAILATGPEQVSMTFSEPVRAGFSDVTVIGPDGRQWQAAEPSADGAVVSIPVQPLGRAGEYTVGYRVLSADSHPVQGSISFTLTRPGPGAASSALSTTPDGGDSAPAAGAGDRDGRTPVWPWVAGAGVLLVLGVLAALRVARSS